jgi:plasmid stabilization system protein ParE
MSNVPLTVRIKARQDILRAAKWYEQRQPSLGTAFVDQMGATLQSIEDNPSLYPMVYHGIRRALLRRFPCAVFYIVRETGVSVVAVLHCKQDRDRLESR